MLLKDKSCDSKNQTIASGFLDQVPKPVIENIPKEPEARLQP
jgi:hypothetical protein